MTEKSGDRTEQPKKITTIPGLIQGCWKLVPEDEVDDAE